MLRSLLPTLFFNFRFLPFEQAIKLPIILYKPHFAKLSGKIRIDSNRIYPKMIMLGRNRIPFYPNNGVYMNIEGTLTFKGACDIGNDSKISVGQNAENYSATSSLKLTCSKHIRFSKNVTVGWDCIFMDSDFHRLTKVVGGYTKGIGEILIGSNNWFCCKNVVLKNTVTPDFCTVAANTVLNKDYLQHGTNILLGNDNEVIVRAEGIYLDPKDENSYKITI